MNNSSPRGFRFTSGANRASVNLELPANYLIGLCFISSGWVQPSAFAQLAITNIGQTDPVNVFLSNTAATTFTTVFEGNGGAVDASDGRGQSFLTPTAGSGNAWNLSAVTVQAQGSGSTAFPASSFDFMLSVYQWPTNNPENRAPLASGAISGALLYRQVATMSSVPPTINDRYVFDLGTTILLQENTAYGFVFEFEPTSGGKNSEQLRLRVSGNDFTPGDLWRTEFDVTASQYIASSNFNTQDLVFYLSGTETTASNLPTLTVDRDTGNLTLEANTVPLLEIIEYDIRTTAGAFEPGNWNSIQSQGLDADDTWFTFSAPGDTTELAEGTLGELLLVGTTSSIDFGNVWVPSHVEDVEMFLKLSDGSTVTAEVVYSGDPIPIVDLAGDYNNDQVVDLADYSVWRQTLGTSQSIPNDTTPGSVALADYEVWRDQFGAANNLSTFAISEPTSSSTVLLGFGLLAISLGIQRRWSTRGLVEASSRASKGLVLAFCVSAAGCFVGEARAQVEIDPNLPVGPTVERFGWDLKGSVGRANTMAKAQTLYGDVAANLVRIPIFVDAHFSDGSVNANRYSTLITSIQNIKAVNPEVEVFASVKLEGGNTFVGPASEPGWVTAGTAAWPFDSGGSIFNNQSNRPNPEFYSQLVADYFTYMRSEGVEIDYIGINNETDGALGVNRYVGTVDLLNSELNSRRFNLANLEFVAPDTFGPNTAINITNNLADRGRLDTVDIIGSHAYPGFENHTRDKWVSLSKDSGGKELWHTELHKNPANANNGSSAEQNITRMRDGMGVFFSVSKAGGGAVDAQGDLVGASSFVWWGGGSNDNVLDNRIKQELINTTIDGHPVLTTPDFNEQTTNDNSPLYQAYLQDNKVTLWIGNPGNEQVDFSIDLLSGRLIDDLHSTPSGTYWQGCDELGACNGTFGNAVTPSFTGELIFDVSSDKSMLTIDSIPFNSIAVLSFDLAGSGDLNGDTLLTNADVQQFISGWQNNTDAGDLDFDGDTDRDDWFYLRAAFLEAGQGAALQVATVPEPASLTIISFSLVFIFARQRRYKSLF